MGASAGTATGWGHLRERLEIAVANFRLGMDASSSGLPFSLSVRLLTAVPPRVTSTSISGTTTSQTFTATWPERNDYYNDVGDLLFFSERLAAGGANRELGFRVLAIRTLHDPMDNPCPKFGRGRNDRLSLCVEFRASRDVILQVRRHYLAA